MLVPVITTKLQSLTRADEKLKTIMKWLRFIITLINTVLMLNAQITNKHDSDAWLASKHRKHPNLVHTHRVLEPLSSANTIPMLRYVTTAYFTLSFQNEKYLNTSTEFFLIFLNTLSNTLTYF